MKNFNESRKACEQIIKSVSKPLEDNLGAGVYAVPGGYKMFCQDLQRMTDRYNLAEGRGVMVRSEVMFTLIKYGKGTTVHKTV